MREPIPGKVKKRLARGIGNARACRVYEKFVRATLRTAKRSRISFRIFCTPPNAIPAVRRCFRIKSPVTPQMGNLLGARMKNAFRTMLRESSGAILIGTDSPTMPVRFIRRAAGLLATSRDLVLGPAEDGGYYLIGLTRAGFRKAQATIFSRIDWGGPGVFRKTLDRASRLSLKIGLIDPWYDIDTESDLRRAAKDLKRAGIC